MTDTAQVKGRGGQVNITHYMRPRFVRYASQEADATVRMDCGRMDGMLLVMWDEDQEPGLRVQNGQGEWILIPADRPYIIRKSSAPPPHTPAWSS